MTSDVVLSAALRSNLLSLQSTQRSIDITQNRLSTGKKVNSALDNPQSFFAAQALTNRAGDLTRLLDSIGQSIQVIKAADNGVTALTSLINQADSIATSAQDALTQGQIEAKLTGTVNLSGVSDLTNFAGSGIVTGDTVNISVYNPTTGAIIGTAETITIVTGDSAATFAQKITDAFANDLLHPDAVVASLNASGQLEIKSTGGQTIRIDTLTFGGATVAENQTAVTALGLSKYFTTEENNGGATQQYSSTTVAGTSIKSTGLKTGTAVAQRGDQISGLAGFAGISSNADLFNLTLNTGDTLSIDLFTGGLSIQGFLDKINNNATFGQLLRADFDDVTGQISLTAVDSSVNRVTLAVPAGVSETLAFGFGSKKLDAALTDNASEVINLGQSAGNIADLETQYNSVLTQIDALVSNGDTGYRGTNLLNGDNLITTFNESRTSTLTTSGVSFTSTGLSLSTGNFSRSDTVAAALTEVRNALTAVRNFGSSLAGDLSVIQTRQDFTNSIINTLKEGASNLTTADSNEEGAKILALQTRQSLGITSLSLASQANQAVLRLFG